MTYNVVKKQQQQNRVGTNARTFNRTARFLVAQKGTYIYPNICMYAYTFDFMGVDW